MVAPEPAPGSSSWIDQYDRLLQASGLDREAVLSGALTQQPHARPAALSLAECLEKPALLVDQVHRDYPEERAPQAIRARLAVLHQDLALSVIALMVLQLFRDGQTSIPDPDRIFLSSISPSDQPGLQRWHQIPGAEPVGESTFIPAMGRLTEDWYPVFRHGLGVSPGAYWSSMALGLSAPFSAVWNLAEPNTLCELAQQWLETFESSVNQFVDWIPVTFDGQATGIPQRKGCCLKYLLPDGDYCGTCGIYRKQRMLAINQRRQRQEPGQWLPGR